MTDDQSETTESTGLAEPVVAASPAAAGSAASASIPPEPQPSTGQPSAGRDLLRALACAALVAASVASPGIGVAVAPFVPVIVALRLLRRPSGDGATEQRSRFGAPTPRSFLVSASAAAIVAAVLSAASDSVVPPAITTALLLVPILGIVHARAAREDPVTAGDQPEWPEPRLATGFTPTAIAWTLGTVAVIAVVLVSIGGDSLHRSASNLVGDAYRPYTDACSSGGALAGRESFCSELDRQRRDVQQAVDDHAAELLGALAAIFALAAAGTAHMTVLWRARKTAIRVRPSMPMSRLEVHWIWAYVMALGLVGLLVPGSAGDQEWVRAASVGAAMLGASALLAQGAGLLAHSLANAPRRGLLITVLVLGVVVASPAVATVLFTLGVLDQAFRTRRRVPKAPGGQ
ncbi:MAG: hypothetical protein KDC46_03635 [Thermoleophilia bacterium]|nr:hypothetical protein [Thermoleophilia bacterium]